jgi:hypothetical protein
VNDIRLSDLWLEYVAASGASTWDSYRGWCQCPECRAFRDEFEEWLLSVKRDGRAIRSHTLEENA